MSLFSFNSFTAVHSCDVRAGGGGRWLRMIEVTLPLMMFLSLWGICQRLFSTDAKICGTGIFLGAIAKFNPRSRTFSCDPVRVVFETLITHFSIEEGRVFFLDFPCNILLSNFQWATLSFLNNLSCLSCKCFSIFSNTFTGNFLEREQQSSSNLLLHNLMRQWDERILSLKFWKTYFLVSFLPSAELISGFEHRLFGKTWCFRQAWLKCRWVLCLTIQRLVLM